MLDHTVFISTLLKRLVKIALIFKNILYFLLHFCLNILNIVCMPILSYLITQRDESFPKAKFKILFARYLLLTDTLVKKTWMYSSFWPLTLDKHVSKSIVKGIQIRSPPSKCDRRQHVWLLQGFLFNCYRHDIFFP
jgi:hypothetical protein